MKFLCIKCDRPLARSSREVSSDHGQVDVVLDCRHCEARFGLLAEERESWMLESVEEAGLGEGAEDAVSDDDRELPRPPISRAAGESDPEGADDWSPAQAGATSEQDDATRARAGAHLLAKASQAGAAGLGVLGVAATPLRWTPEAERKLLDLSTSVRRLERERVESLARRRGEDEVTARTVEHAASSGDAHAASSGDAHAASSGDERAASSGDERAARRDDDRNDD